MHAQGQAAGARKTFAPMPVTDDEIRERYLDRAIRELNLLSREIQECRLCPRGALMPVLGSGHPQADIMLAKYAPRPSEIEEGVAFYGRSGTALMKSLRRLQIDPLAVYGTLFVKCPVADTALADPGCLARVAEEIAIVQPKIIVLMARMHSKRSTSSPCRLRARSHRSSARCSRSRRRWPLCSCRTSTSRSTRSTQSAPSGARFARSATGGRSSRRTDLRVRRLARGTSRRPIKRR